ncbi:aminoglycoside 6'-N-acetyltransferase [Luteolibacter soli]|uniref:Aminoglycoside N(6')-acetyltransferase type 1 n=1 Tax=Luteolibacter soli TaxID=3135280 RepID=A0ABU9AQM0_9BACT
MSQHPTYRIARETDRPQWLSLRYDLWPHCPIDRHRLEIEQLLKSEGIVAVADINGTLAGFAEVSLRHDHVEGTRSSPVPYLEGWFVSPEYRRHGIGRGLLDFVEQWAVARGFNELASDAELENLEGINLHAKLGFAEVGRTVHFVKPLPERSIRS